MPLEKAIPPRHSSVTHQKGRLIPSWIGALKISFVPGLFWVGKNQLTKCSKLTCLPNDEGSQTTQPSSLHNAEVFTCILLRPAK